MHKLILKGRQQRASLGIKSRKTPTRETKSLVVAPTRLSVHDTQVVKAVAALMNNSTVLVSESKSGSTKTISFNVDVLTTLRGLFPSNMTYLFQVHQNGTVASTSGGVVATSVPINNTTGPTISEWAALAALFDECKAIKTTLGFTGTTLGAPWPSNATIPLWIAFDHINSSSSAPGFGNVQRLAQSRCISNSQGDRGSGRHRQTAKIASSRAFAATAATTSTNIDVGLNGEWYLVGQNSTAVSSSVGNFDVCTVISFRNRA
jgi:hypothetical protein